MDTPTNLSPQLSSNIRCLDMSANNHIVMTIGHSNHELEIFLDLLQDNDVSTVADVRSVPYSRYRPHFNKAALEGSLKERGMEYLFLGREFGARVDDPACVSNGRIQYALLARRSEFLEGIELVKDRILRNRVTLMCAEEDPLTCHRTILVARELDKEGIRIEHIRGDGRVETHDDVKTRLLKLTGLYQGEGSQMDMFQQQNQDNEKLLSNAFEIQEEKIAYRTVQPN